MSWMVLQCCVALLDSVVALFVFRLPQLRNAAFALDKRFVSCVQVRHPSWTKRRMHLNMLLWISRRAFLDLQTAPTRLKIW